LIHGNHDRRLPLNIKSISVRPLLEDDFAHQLGLRQQSDMQGGLEVLVDGADARVAGDETFNYLESINR
jgi:hypothetical protein